MNIKYQQGRKFEYRVRDYFIKSGYFVVRSAGSKGLADLIAIPQKNNHLLKPILVQCKSGDGRINAVELKALKALAYKYDIIPALARVVSGRHLYIENLILNEELKI